MRSLLVFVAAVALGCSSTTTVKGGSGGSSQGGAGGASGGPCTQGVDQTYEADMVGCKGSKVHCDAELLCGTGWHLCSFDEYVARGGATTKATNARWLRSCARDGAGSECPTQLLCTQCESNNPVASTAITWTCDSSQPLQTTDLFAAGITSSPNSPARHVGCPTSKCAYVEVQRTNFGLGATCCK